MRREELDSKGVEAFKGDYLQRVEEKLDRHGVLGLATGGLFGVGVKPRRDERIWFCFGECHVMPYLKKPDGLCVESSQKLNEDAIAVGSIFWSMSSVH
ncbi:hypothetical protein IH992_21585 [Candidatus Poribacteria bacterium]|nr:hypothetical protein [Candidatus Poribacteria bacterium]